MSKSWILFQCCIYTLNKKSKINQYFSNLTNCRVEESLLNAKQQKLLKINKLKKLGGGWQDHYSSVVPKMLNQLKYIYY